MPIEHRDVGCWVIKCNPVTGTDYFGEIAGDEQPNGSATSLRAASWCLSPRSGRSRMVADGDLIALWVTGPKNPGVYEVGWVAENREDESAAVGPGLRVPRKVHYRALRLGVDDHITRSEMQSTPTLDRCEQLRAPMMSNPSYLTRDEARALARLVAERLPAEGLSAARWDTLLR